MLSLLVFENLSIMSLLVVALHLRSQKTLAREKAEAAKRLAAAKQAHQRQLQAEKAARARDAAAAKARAAAAAKAAAAREKKLADKAAAEARQREAERKAAAARHAAAMKAAERQRQIAAQQAAANAARIAKQQAAAQAAKVAAENARRLAAEQAKRAAAERAAAAEAARLKAQLKRGRNEYYDVDWRGVMRAGLCVRHELFKDSVFDRVLKDVRGYVAILSMLAGVQSWALCNGGEKKGFMAGFHRIGAMGHGHDVISRITAGVCFHSVSDVSCVAVSVGVIPDQPIP